MSRKVDRRKPLSESDRAYLLARGRPVDVYPVGEAESEEEQQRQSDEGKQKESEEEPDDDYDEWSPDDLKEELRERKLPVSGNKAVLIGRLREHDADNPE